MAVRLLQMDLQLHICCTGDGRRRGTCDISKVVPRRNSPLEDLSSKGFIMLSGSHYYFIIKEIYDE